MVFSPVQEVFWQRGQSVSGFFSFLSDFGNLQEKNKELEAKNLQLLSENAQLKELQNENETLREALGLQIQKEFNLILGQTISLDSSQDYIVVDRGSKDGIRVGMPVITSQKILCGKVVEAYENFSRIELISAPASSFDAKIIALADPNQDIFGVVKGKGNLGLQITLVPRDKEIQAGDQIATSPLEGIFPKGFLIGSIEDINKSDVEPFQSATVSPLFGLRDLNMVFIITNSK